MKKQYDFSGAKRSPVIPVSKNKTRITIRLDSDLLDWFKEQVHQVGGGNYQTLINDALHAYVRTQQEPIETIVRRVVREELSRSRTARSGKRAA